MINHKENFPCTTSYTREHSCKVSVKLAQNCRRSAHKILSTNGRTTWFQYTPPPTQKNIVGGYNYWHQANKWFQALQFGVRIQIAKQFAYHYINNPPFWKLHALISDPIFFVLTVFWPKLQKICFEPNILHTQNCVGP